MRWLIRKAQGFSSGQEAQQDRIVETDKLRVGADTQADLVLVGTGIESAHLSLSKGRRGKTEVKTASPTARFCIDDNKPLKKASLAVGQSFCIGDYRLTMLEAPTGVDVGFEITRTASNQKRAELLFPGLASNLKDAGLRMRAWSWYLMLTILVIGLLTPLLWVLVPGKALESVPLVNTADTLWNPGPLARAHHLPGMADNCQVCHSELFSPVKDSDCKACHSVTGHLPMADAMARHKGPLNAVDGGPEPKYMEGSDNAHQEGGTRFEEGRCATCHIEHKEPSVVIRQDETMCTTCHEEIRPAPGHGVPAEENGKEKGIASFSEHPQFKLSLLNLQGSQWQVQRLEFSADGVSESSNLQFSHTLHMNPEGIDGPDGRTELQCSSCHQPEQDGLLMKPITMEAHCSACHTLAFEPTDGERQVPHSDLATVLQSLEEYYSRLYAIQNGPVRSTVNLDRPAKRPGKPKPDFYTAMKEWADEKADEALEELVKNKACSTCHVVEGSVADAEKLPAIKPVRITRQWYPKSRFDHSSHQVFECAGCHSAEDSDEASDILIPDLENCRTCHAGEGDHQDLLDAEVKTVSSCMSCHQYHLPEMDVRYE